MNKVRGIVFFLLGVLLLGGAALVVVNGIKSRAQDMVDLQQETEEATTDPVAIIIPRRGDAMQNLDLPGDVMAWYQAPIYAQVSGYVNMWYTDYGAVVRRGDILATINVPKLDAQFQAAKARVDFADSKLGIAELTAKRYKNLEGTQAVSKQSVDVQAANARMQRAELETAKQDLAQFEALERFKTLVAPFDGIVTARSVNVGDYVSEVGGPLGDKGDPTELFTVADVHKLRIFVHVPQDYISMLKDGVTAEVTAPQHQNEVFHASFLTDASALDKDSRTVTTELVMDNPGNKLWPGSYAEVHFHVPSESKALLVPENALIFQEFGEQLAVVDANNKIKLKNVEVGRNLGSDVEILNGIEAGDRVVNTPSAGLLDGQTVRIVDSTPGYNAVPEYKGGVDTAAVPEEKSKSGKGM